MYPYTAYCNICERVRGGIIATISDSLVFICASNHRTRWEVINHEKEVGGKEEGCLGDEGHQRKEVSYG